MIWKGHRVAGNRIRRLWAYGIGVAMLALTSPAVAPVGQAGSGARAAEHHVHIRSAAGAEIAKEMARVFGGPRSTETMLPTTAADVLEALDAASVDRGLVLSIAYMFGRPDLEVENEYAKVRAENDYVAEQVATAPNRLVGACSVNPLADYAFDEIERCAEDQRLGALKLHLANSDVDLRNDAHVERLALVFQRLGRLALPAVVHVRTRHPDYGAEDAGIFVARVLSQAPRLLIQIAHMGGWGGYDEATDAALGAFAEALADGRLKIDLNARLIEAALPLTPDEPARIFANANTIVAPPKTPKSP
jgi:predicted TIM-barrel fold metal-dependent hydrolase